MSTFSKEIEQLNRLIEKSVSQYHSVAATKDNLMNAGFAELKMEDTWKLEKGGKYVVVPHGSNLIAFTVGEQFEPGAGMRIAASHGDYPGFRIKPDPEMRKAGYVRLNVEGYGGVNLMSWMDKPLSVAGKVVLKSEDIFAPKTVLVDMERPLLIIPNVAIHMNREMNKGTELKKQSHMLPVLGMDEEGMEELTLLQILAEKLDVKPEEILSYDLNVYNPEKGCLVGAKEELYSAPRLDNLTSVSALTGAITEKKTRTQGIQIMAVFDHEEIGSDTKEGAGSVILSMMLQRIYESLGCSREDLQRDLAKTLMLSVDVAHAFHPAYDGKYDPVTKCIPNKGFCMKQACAQTYATDCEFMGILQQICDSEQIAYQKFVNNSDERGGGTLGNIMAVHIPVKTQDVGVPILAMHSSRETMGAADQKSLQDMLTYYYTK